MKTLFVAAALIISTSLASAQPWLTDHREATRKARVEGKRLLINFTGSDWCGWCIKQDREVFTTKEFQHYAKRNLVLLEVDFPRRGGSPRQRAVNERLAAKYRVDSYPTFILQSPDGQPIDRFGYVRGGPKAFIRKLEKRHQPHHPHRSHRR